MPTYTKMGFEGLIYYGAAGSTASTQLTNIRDETYTFEKEDGDTTVRGDGSAVPIETMTPVLRRVSLEWTMINKPADTELAAMLTAAYACTAIAIRTKDRSGGKGFDGDVYLTVEHGKPFKGEQTYRFTATPTLEGGRTPSLYV